MRGKREIQQKCSDTNWTHGSCSHCRYSNLNAYIACSCIHFDVSLQLLSILQLFVILFILILTEVTLVLVIHIFHDEVSSPSTMFKSWRSVQCTQEWDSTGLRLCQMTLHCIASKLKHVGRSSSLNFKCRRVNWLIKNKK